MTKKELYANDFVISVTDVRNPENAAFSPPSAMLSIEIIEKYFLEIKDYALENGIKELSLTFAGYDFNQRGLKHFTCCLEKLITIFPEYLNLQLYINTNGNILYHDWFVALKKHNILMKIFLFDNFMYKSDPFVEKVLMGINELKSFGIEENYEIIFPINWKVNPLQVYNFIKNSNVRRIDFKFPEFKYETKIQDFKNKSNETYYGNWLIEIFNSWFEDSKKPIIRTFNYLINLTLGVNVISDVYGTSFNRRVFIDAKGFTTFESNFEKSVCIKLKNVYLNDLNYLNFYSKRNLCSICTNCLFKDTCGGGKFSHRYSSLKKFDNPSVYCSDLLKIITHVYNKLSSDLPKEKQSEYNMEFISFQESKESINPQRIKILSDFIRY